MPKKPRYPRSLSGDTYSPYLNPVKPKKPSKTLPALTIIFSIKVKNYDTIEGEDLTRLNEALSKEGKLYVESEVEFEEVGSEVTLSVYSSEETPNPNYDEQCVTYEKDLARYSETLAWFKECEKTRKEYEKEIKLEKDRKQYEKLKKQFESQ